MEKISLEEVVKYVNGKVLSGNVTNKSISTVVTDSRVNTKQGLFIAIKGENTDGHKYIDDAVQNGAIAVLITDDVKEYIAGVVYIKVEDGIKALQNLALAYRLKFNIPVVAVTGSVGKTTTKDMIASVLATKYNVLKTEGNFNSEIGAPMTVLRLNKDYDIAVIEMGMDHLGQISNISRIAKPDTAVITNIGVAHIEYLKTRENILKAKCEVFENLAKEGVAVLNADDDMLVNVDNNFKKIWYGKGQSADIQVQNVVVDYTNGVVKADLFFEDHKYDLIIPGLSKHLVYAAMSAIAVGTRYGFTIEQALVGVKKYTHTKMRMDVYKLQDNILVIDDTYNANPDSMKSLINTVKEADTKSKMLVLGDMFELGEQSDELHIQVLEYAVKSGIDKIFVTGENMNKAANALKDGSISCFETKEELINNLDKIIVPYSIVGIKASRGMKFENITEKILEKYRVL